MLDDPQENYWVRQEKYYAIWEAMFVWGAYTGHWRARDDFYLDPAKPDPYYDMSVLFPVYRPRNWTLGKLVEDIQYMSLENPGGVSGTGMSGQIGIQAILQSISKACNRFFVDACIPYSVNQSVPSPAPNSSIVNLPQNCVIVHRCMWQDTQTGTWYPLWRQDAWAQDRAFPNWTTNPDWPRVFSESEISPITLEVYPAPNNTGKLEAITVDSQEVDLSNSNQVLFLPNEWVHAIKYCALADLFSNESQCVDVVRATYAEARYKQALEMTKAARSIIRATAMNTPLPIDSMAAMDAGQMYWRNQSGPPVVGSVLYDILVVSPMPDNSYPITVDMCITAPIPQSGADFVNLGKEEIRAILFYAAHVLTFKCGGSEFQNTFDNYDDFMRSIENRNQITSAKILYLKSILGQAQKELSARPDKL